MTMEQAVPLAKSVDPEEVRRFAAMADAWWDPAGKSRALHRLNPVRIGFIRDRACLHFGRDPKADRPLSGLRLLDLGCGGGLASEPMARLGAIVVGADAAAENVQAAAQHAVEMDLAIDYRPATAESLVTAGESFDVVLCLEVVEHVADLDSLLRSCAALLQPGGLFVAATINRTFKAFALAVVGAEYLLQWLPKGTHDWRKFLRPHELARIMRRAGLDITEVAGIRYEPIRDNWSLTPDLDINYMMVARKPRS